MKLTVFNNKMLKIFFNIKLDFNKKNNIIISRKNKNGKKDECRYRY